MSQIKVDLLIGANTSAAQNNIKQLSASLAQISKTTPVSLDNGPLHTAVQTAQQLQTHLANAVNVDTGKLNLHQFNTSLKQAGMDLNTLTQRLLLTGQTGQQAFVQMANAIAYAQTPVLSFGSKLSGLFNTLTNTLKWSIASKAIQGVTTAISGAIKHAEDLNTALNKIRIVTGYSQERMAAFANDARKAAKELGTTSTEYAKAALIFYQQGLKGDAVTERANTVIKMANVIGQSADTVSDWMTAIWNNFDNGSKSLEYYADVLVELGANTASSADEITQGLEKFAAIADTVGLSYEYAAASLATVTAETRQSADVVGTAFKTIFARMEGLKLGDTLEDGTTLNQYTEAMAKVGIHIKDSNGQLKEMDTILNEMGEKWAGLNKDQQVALAQSVGGIRQYNQLIALMDNWDTVKLNVELAEDAEGTLQEQADIWGESWEAASKRAKESANVFYENFLNDDTVVDITNLFADLIDTIDDLIDSFGGIGPLALTLVGIFSKSLFPMLMNGFHSIIGNLSIIFGFAQRNVIATQSNTMALIQEVNARNDVSLSMKKQLELSSFLINAKKELALQTRGLSKAQKEAANAQMQALETEIEAIQVGYQEIEMLEKKARAHGATVTANMNSTTREQTAMFNRVNQFANSSESGGFTKGQVTDITKTVMDPTMTYGKAIGNLRQAEMGKAMQAEQHANMESSLNGMKKPLEEKQAAGVQLTEQEETNLKQIQDLLKQNDEILKQNNATLDEAIKKWETVARLVRQGKENANDPNAMFKATAVQQDEKTGALSERRAQASSSHARLTLDSAKGNGDLTTEEKLLAGSVRSMQKRNVERMQEAGMNAKLATNTEAGGMTTQSVNVTASQESLAMASQMTGEYRAQAENLTATLDELGIAESSVTAKIKEAEAAKDKNGKTTAKSRSLEKQWKKEVDQLHGSLSKLSSGYKMSGSQQNRFKAGLDLLAKKTPQGVQQGLKKISGVLKELRTSTKMTEQEMADLGDKILQELVEAGGGEDDLRRLMDTMKQMGFDAEKLNASFQKLQKPKIEVSPFQKLGQTVATSAGQLSMLISSMNMLKSAFKDGIFSAEGMMSALMAISMLLPSLTVLQKAFNLAKSKEAIVTTAATAAAWLNTKATEAQTRAEEKGAKKSLKSSILKIGGHIASWIAKGPVGWTIAAISAAAIAAIIGVSLFSGGGKSEEEEKAEESEQQFKEAQAVVQTANAWKEKNDEIAKLNKTYDELSKKTNRTIEEEKQLKQAQEDIINQMPELLEKYQELGDELGEDWTGQIDAIGDAIASGDVELATQLEADLDKKAQAATAKKAAEGMTGGAYSVAAAMVEADEDEDGEITDDGKYEITIGDTDYSLDTTNGDEFIKGYQKMLDRKKELEKNGEVGTDEYAKLKEVIDASAESYESLKTLQSDALPFTLTNLMNENGMVLDNIETYEDYEKAKKEFIELAKASTSATEDEAAAFFEGQEAVSDYAAAEQKLDYVKEKYGAKTAKEVQKFREGLSEDDKKLFMEIDFSKFSSKEALNGQIKMLQKEAEAKPVEIKLNASEQALDMLKEDMSMEDWAKMETDSGFNWGEDGIVKFSTFVNATYEEQSAYLLKMQEESYESFMKSNQEKLDLLKESLATMEALDPDKRGENYDAEVAAIREQIEATSILMGKRKSAKDAEQREKDESKKKSLDNIERYYAEEKALDRLEKQLDKITKAKDRAFGKAKLNLMDAETDKIKEQIAAEEALLEQRKKDLRSDQAAVNQFGFSTNASGDITNYEEIKQRNINNWYATLSKEDAEKKVAEMDEAISKYEESLEGLENSQESIAEKQERLADLALEKIQFKVQMQIDLGSDEMARLDFLLSALEDDAFAAAERISLLGEQADVTLNNIEATEQGIADIMADVAANGGEMTEAQAEALRGYRDELISYNDELLTIKNTVQEELTSAYDAWNGKLDESIGYLDSLSATMDNYQNIIDIVGQDNLGISDATMAQMRSTRQANANDKAAAARDKLDANKEQLARAQKALSEATNEDDKKYWEEQVKYAQDQVMSAESEFMDAWSNALQVAADNFAANVQTIADNFNKSVSGIYGSLEEMSEAFDRQKEVSERYLSDYEKTYEISKLNRKLQQDLAKTTSTSASKELRDLQAELLAMGEDGSEISKKDIEYMQKKYDLLLAEQALKDAQNAKSVVRLQQDSEGNYGYVYTADQDKTDQAQQNYEDKLYALQSYNEQVLLESQEQIIAVNQEFQDAMLAIQENANLSNEEKKAKMEEITAYYTEKLGYWEGEADKFLQYNQDCAAQFTVDYDTNTSTMVGLNETMSDSWSSMSLSFSDTLLGKMNPDMTSFKEHGEECYDAMNQAGEGFIEAVEQYEEDNRKATKAAGEDYDNMNEKVSKDLKNVQDESSKTAKKVDEMKTDMNKDLDDVTKKVKSFQTEYSSQMNNIRSATNTTISSVNELIKKYNELAAAAKQDFTPDDLGSSGGGGGNGAKDLKDDGNGKKAGTTTYTYTVKKKGAKDGITTLVDSSGKTMYAKTSNLTFNENNDKANAKGTVGHTPVYRDGKMVDVINYSGDWTQASVSGDRNVHFNDTGKGVGGNHDSDDDLHEDMRKYATYINRGDTRYYAFKFDNDDYQNDPSEWYFAKIGSFIDDAGNQGAQLNGSEKFWTFGSYDTGGYTGEWGPEGRLAMLHQKEIVLNAHDTENLLSIISMVRDMNDRIELNARAMQYGLTAAYTANNIKSQNDTLQQEVHITAEFPNATNHSEIEEAFRNLTNLASQYANRKF